MNPIDGGGLLGGLLPYKKTGLKISYHFSRVQNDAISSILVIHPLIEVEPPESLDYL